MASLGTPEQFIVGALANNLGQYASPLTAPGALLARGAQAMNSAMTSSGSTGNSVLDDLNAYGASHQVGDVGTGGPGAAYGNTAGAPAKQQGASPQQLVAERAMQEARDRQARLSAQKWFGGGGGNPLSTVGGNIFGAVAGNQLGGFLNYGNQLNQTYNSASGPYGQLQYAAAVTAPSRADRAIASLTTQSQERMNARDNATKAMIAKLIAGSLASPVGGGQLGENMSDFQRYSPLYDPRLRRVEGRPVFAGG